ncbi:TrmH family RNA methyltransferase [Candidatus Saccharibacteria bacterium]|nr:TrmH family RNA methyltransferase [Candidatus Saccharibacteria bacterium]
MKTILVAVDVRSAHNIGSLFRTCDGFGADLWLVGICPRPMGENDDRLPYIAQKAHKEIAKTAIGAEETVNWQYFPDFHEAVDGLRGLNCRVIAIEQSEHSKSISGLERKNNNIALIVGREVEGLFADELAVCDEHYEIPMQGKKESFNVSVAAAIGLYQVALLESK